MRSDFNGFTARIPQRASEDRHGPSPAESAGKLLFRRTIEVSPTPRGGMGERLIPAVLKTVVPERVPGVRIPLPPPFHLFIINDLDEFSSSHLALTRRNGRSQAVQENRIFPATCSFAFSGQGREDMGTCHPLAIMRGDWPKYGSGSSRAARYGRLVPGESVEGGLDG